MAMLPFKPPVQPIATHIPATIPPSCSSLLLLLLSELRFTEVGPHLRRGQLAGSYMWVRQDDTYLFVSSRKIVESLLNLVLGGFCVSLHVILSKKVADRV